MKKIIFLLVGAVLLSMSCKKAVEESIDCVMEMLFVTYSYTVDPAIPLEVTYTLNYTGEFAVTITWDFGDGTTQTVAGKTVTHIYPDAGTYQVKALITLSAADRSSCTSSKERSIDVGL